MFCAAGIFGYSGAHAALPQPYTQNSHTLFYVNFNEPYDSSSSSPLPVTPTGTPVIASQSLTFPELADDPSVPDPKDCKAFDFGPSRIGERYFSTTTGPSAPFSLALRAKGRGSAFDLGALVCHNTLLQNLGTGKPFPDYTMGFWLKFAAPPSGPPFFPGYRLFTALSSPGGPTKLITFTLSANGKIGHQAGGDGFESVVTLPTPNTWHHILVVFDRTSGIRKLYIDGILDSTNTDTGTPAAGTTDPQFIAGAENLSFTIGADIDDLFIEDHAWTQGEVDGFFGGVQQILP